MAWNPHPHVAAARDAAEKLDDAAMCVVLWVTKDVGNMGIGNWALNQARAAGLPVVALCPGKKLVRGRDAIAFLDRQVQTPGAV